MKVNDRVTVKTDGGPRRRVWCWQLKSLAKVQCTWYHWKTTRSAFGFLTNWGIRTVFL